MARKITIDPISRIEGHLKVEVTIDGGKVADARCSGMLFRGFEIFLRGRDPRDAQRLTQRVCGVCPAAHATASSLALDDAFGVAGKIPDNGRIIRNLILGSNFLQSHILHFYHLAALDYVDVTAAADYKGDDPDMKSLRNFLDRGRAEPFVPRYEGGYRLDAETNRAAAAHYIQALKMRRKAHEILAIFGGKMPHNMGIVPGGVTSGPEVDKIAAFLHGLNEIRDFIDNVYIPDVLAVAGAYRDHFAIGRGAENFLCYGSFDGFFPSGVVDSSLGRSDLKAGAITEDVTSSWYDNSDGLHPSEGQTVPAPDKEGAYSWLKSPRYKSKVAEVGPLARVLCAYLADHEKIRPLVDQVLAAADAQPADLLSVCGRHAARALETKVVADAMAEWVVQLRPGEPIAVEYEIPEKAKGAGMADAPRGAVGHWIRIEGGRIGHYQLVVPTTWNASPRDAAGNPGPMEQALIDTPIADEENPFEIVRIVRSFDPCLACSVHAVDHRGRPVAGYRIS
jgi:hydrogenase large subunit